jgi:MOSC domain-containing protein YiiM
MSDVGRIVSVNVGTPRVVEWHGHDVESGIWKQPVDTRVAVRGTNLVGDGQADLRVHGGYDKAVYAYEIEDYTWWSTQLGVEVGPATFGENLTTEGLDLNAMAMGMRWHIGAVELEVAGPRMPCFKLGMRMGDAGFVDVFEEAARFGVYLRIVTEGDVGAGDEIVVDEPTDPGPTVYELGVGYSNPAPGLIDRVLAAPAAGATWHEWVERRRRRST